jgi:hypothetical protein
MISTYIQRKEWFLLPGRCLAAILLTLLLTTVAWAGSKENVLYSFVGGSSDGAYPTTALVSDKAGNLYGTAYEGGSYGHCSPFGQSCGVVFELTPKHGGGWSESVIYTFTGGTDGGSPDGTLIIDSNGNLYGTTYLGGTQSSCPGGPCGTVYELTPPKNSGSWQETVLYSFGGGTDGAYPRAGLVMDKQGNLYGTTDVGGLSGGCNVSGFGGYGCGTVFELSPAQSGWTESILYVFTGGTDGGFPYAGLTIDKSGNLYGTTYVYGNANACGGYGCGTVYKLSHGQNGWAENTIYTFTGVTDGSNPVAGLSLDAAGNLYGTAASGGTDLYYGTVFELKASKGGWTEKTLYSFTGLADGGVPEATLLLKGSTLYGTTYTGGTGTKCGLFGGMRCGTAFKVSKGKKGWKEVVFHSFNYDGTDGAEPAASVIRDSAGNLLGTASIGGSRGLGVVFQITP